MEREEKKRRANGDIKQELARLVALPLPLPLHHHHHSPSLSSSSSSSQQAHRWTRWALTLGTGPRRRILPLRTSQETTAHKKMHLLACSQCNAVRVGAQQKGKFVPHVSEYVRGSSDNSSCLLNARKYYYYYAFLKNCSCSCSFFSLLDSGSAWWGLTIFGQKAIKGFCVRWSPLSFHRPSSKQQKKKQQQQQKLNRPFKTMTTMKGSILAAVLYFFVFLAMIIPGQAAAATTTTTSSTVNENNFDNDHSGSSFSSSFNAREGLFTGARVQLCTWFCSDIANSSPTPPRDQTHRQVCHLPPSSHLPTASTPSPLLPPFAFSRTPFNRRRTVLSCVRMPMR